jgi:hypothetical protein
MRKSTLVGSCLILLINSGLNLSHGPDLFCPAHCLANADYLGFLKAERSGCCISGYTCKNTRAKSQVSGFKVEILSHPSDFHIRILQFSGRHNIFIYDIKRNLLNRDSSPLFTHSLFREHVAHGGQQEAYNTE